MESGMVYQLLWLFMVYSFLGWVSETGIAIIKNKKLLNRGVLSGPLCIIYGIAAILMTVGFNDLKEAWFFLFLGCMSVGTVIQWITGHLLERTSYSKWWDYSKHKGNLDGYICIRYSVLWGLLGLLGLKYLNPLLISIFKLLPFTLIKITLWILIVLVVIDVTGSYMVAAGIQERFPRVEEVNSRLRKVTIRLRNRITGWISKRMERAYPDRQKHPKRAVKEKVFAKGCSFYKLVVLFFIGAFLGDITETIFCRLTSGVWMSRSSVVWGPFSIVWGLAIVLATELLHNYQNRSDGFIFLFGTVLGGAYEYLCSVFTELVFGQVFWDYSEIPFNLGGRINLLYCFFWGIAAVVWLKKLYPLLSGNIEKIPMKIGKIVSWLLILFMICNIGMSGLALMRYSERGSGIPAESEAAEWLDEHYSDEVMARIYPNAKAT